MNETVKKLLECKPVVLDGAWGTLLQSKGLDPGAYPDEWNLSHPDKVEEVAKAYVEAGSQIIITNTFSANSFCLSKSNMGDKIREINIAGVEISKRAAGEKAVVFASMGPTGKNLAMGEVSAEALVQSFKEQAEALAAGGADGIVVETMMDLKEAEVAAKVAKETGLPVAACLTYGAGKNNDRTLMGNSVEQAVKSFSELGVDIIGSNCGQGLEGMLNICKQLKAQTDLPIWIKSNAGLPQYKNGQTVYDTTAEQFAELVQSVTDAGADFIGGCCGTSPAYITLLAQKFN
ncbi:MAG: methionine synthase [Deltaproteobacteria bacterium]|jgi:5-methyltetrahydrofolate--homocysteine methyltransferase|nr:methionine synthase [Deltaproteobacteria bacterium]